MNILMLPKYYVNYCGKEEKESRYQVNRRVQFKTPNLKFQEINDFTYSSI